MKKFKDYKEKQEYYKEKSDRVIARYDSGKRTLRSGEIIPGIPFVNEEKQKLKAERKLKKERRLKKKGK